MHACIWTLLKSAVTFSLFLEVILFSRQIRPHPIQTHPHPILPRLLRIGILPKATGRISRRPKSGWAWAGGSCRPQVSWRPISKFRLTARSARRGRWEPETHHFLLLLIYRADGEWSSEYCDLLLQDFILKKCHFPKHKSFCCKETWCLCQCFPTVGLYMFPHNDQWLEVRGRPT